MAKNDQELPAKASPRYAGKIFRTLENFGPFRKSDPESGGKPSVFTFDQFAALNPIRQKKIGLDGRPVLDKDGGFIEFIPDGLDPDTYHDDLIDRGIALRSIIVDMNAIPTRTPMATAADGKTNLIRESTAAIVAKQAEVPTMIPVKKDSEIGGAIQQGRLVGAGV